MSAAEERQQAQNHQQTGLRVCGADGHAEPLGRRRLRQATLEGGRIQGWVIGVWLGPAR